MAGIGALAMVATIACNADRAPVAPSGAQVASAPPAASWAASSHAVRPEAIGEANAILRATPLAEDITVSAVIGPRGGRLEIPETGLRLEVPPRAVAAPTTFTVTALKGDMVAYEFGPDGSRFSIPLRVYQASEGTNIGSLPEFAVLQAGYFTGPDMLDHSTKRVRLAEVMPTYGASGMTVGGGVTFLVWHFSGYTVHWGFKPGRGSDDVE